MILILVARLFFEMNYWCRQHLSSRSPGMNGLRYEKISCTGEAQECHCYWTNLHFNTASCIYNKRALPACRCHTATTDNRQKPWQKPRHYNNLKCASHPGCYYEDINANVSSGNAYQFNTFILKCLNSDSNNQKYLKGKYFKVMNENESGD